MNEKDGGGPAFPSPDGLDEGMSMLDYFAAHAPIDPAMTHGWKFEGAQQETAYRVSTKHAYLWADAMLAERKRRAAL